MPTHIFISYATADRKFADRLSTDLRQHNIEIWVDHQNLKPGTLNWEYAIREAIEKADLVLLIATPNSRRSVYVQDEVAIAQMYETSLLPLWFDGIHWIDCVPMGMGKTQNLDMRTDQKYTSSFQTLVKQLKNTNLLPAKSNTPVTIFNPRNPYKGLSAFSEVDAGDYYGRDELVENLVSTVINQESERFLAVIGASGSGKSSLVMAGVVPKLKEEVNHNGRKWIYLPTMTPGREPLKRLAASLSDGSDRNFAIILDKLNDPSTRGLHQAVADMLGNSGERALLLVDQFEEVFTQTDLENERRQFIDNLTTAATESDGSLTVIITMRADFYDRPMSYAELGRLIRTYNQSVLPMTISELYSAIEKPASNVQLEFESGLVAAIVFDLRDEKGALAGALPLLQFALELLFNLRQGRKLTLTAYEKFGGVRGAIGNHADEIFKRLSPETQAALPRVFFALVNVDERGEATRRRADFTSFQGEAFILVTELIDARLLISDRDKVTLLPYVEVAHESLLRNWDRLVKWIDETADDLRLLRKTEIAAIEWNVNERPEYMLWSHEMLEPVYAMKQRLSIEFSGSIFDFTRPESERLQAEFFTAPDYRKMMIIDRSKKIGISAIHVIITALKDRDANIRHGAIQALQNFNQIEVFEAIQKEFLISDFPAQKRLIAVLESSISKSGSIQFLSKAMHFDNPVIQLRSARRLIELGEATTLSALFESIHLFSENSRQELIETLKAFIRKNHKNMMIVEEIEPEITSNSARLILKEVTDSINPMLEDSRATKLKPIYNEVTTVKPTPTKSQPSYIDFSKESVVKYIEETKGRYEGSYKLHLKATWFLINIKNKHNDASIVSYATWMLNKLRSHSSIPLLTEALYYAIKEKSLSHFISSANSILLVDQYVGKYTMNLIYTDDEIDFPEAQQWIQQHI